MAYQWVVINRQITQAIASAQLGITVRQVKCLVRAYKHNDASGLISKHRGQPSNRKYTDKKIIAINIKVDKEAELQIDHQTLQEESNLDGLSGIYISDQNLTNEYIIEHYHGLWQIEESFRIQKHDLKVRPIYPWILNF